MLGVPVKRLALWTVSTLLLMLLASPVQSATATADLAPVSALELVNVTAGICFNCPPEEPADPKPAKPPKLTGYVWEITSSKHYAPTQLSHALAREYVNSSTMNVKYTFTYSDECTHVLTSGGVGISSSLSLTVGTVYKCAAQDTMEITVAPRTRVKLYRGAMRQLATYVAHELAVYSDGSTSRTGRSDSGTTETRYYRYNTVSNPL